MATNDSLGDRMKGYENISRIYLTRRSNIIIRIDGKAFHTFTKGFKKPFDDILMKCMSQTAKYLCENIQGCKIAYTQSDEISLLLTDYDTLTTCAWFDNNIQKMASISASMATLAFNKAFCEIPFKMYIEENISEEEYIKYNNKIQKALFDSRVFLIPEEEVCNYFIWRKQDATRNSIQMVGMANFSHKELFKKSCDNIQDMLFTEKGINWNDLPVNQKRGTCIKKETYLLDDMVTQRSRWIEDLNIPIFTKNREYIEGLMVRGE